eukprot:TRINITY_DN34804_c0_g1_i1.p1 TRINITY_DN34804_c0_g1~~TRINITY_DN34804_c0_g1_i1.p1  ORF type:complete len:146 (-),score=44.29 TRINITY_DN34804_c0_g1_i1:248-685(-)
MSPLPDGAVTNLPSDGKDDDDSPAPKMMKRTSSVRFSEVVEERTFQVVVEEFATNHRGGDYGGGSGGSGERTRADRIRSKLEAFARELMPRLEDMELSLENISRVRERTSWLRSGVTRDLAAGRYALAELRKELRGGDGSDDGRL